MSGIDPLSVCCNKCKAKKNKPCVYLWPKDAHGEPRVRHSWVSELVQAQMDRAGTPTKRPHTERITKARWKYQKEAREAEERLRQSEHSSRDAVIQANAAAVKQEQAELVSWLSNHAQILIDPTKDAKRRINHKRLDEVAFYGRSIAGMVDIRIELGELESMPMLDRARQRRVAHLKKHLKLNETRCDCYETLRVLD